jgi:chromosome segregation ATPase
MELSNKLTISDLNLAQSRERIESLEELLKTRYEQINILESQINELLSSKNLISKNNIELVQRIDDYINYIDNQIKSVS